MFQRLKAWFSRPPTVQRQLQIVYRDPLRVSIAEWRADQKLCHSAAKALSDPIVRQMLDVMHNSHLANATSTSSDVQERNIHFSRIEGYSLALNDLESLAIHKPIAEPLEATFTDAPHPSLQPDAA